MMSLPDSIAVEPCIQPFVLLASASPRRSEILTQLKIEHGVLRVPAPPGPDEPQLPHEMPAAYVQRTARDKLVQARRWLADGDDPAPIPAGWPPAWRQAPILCADTCVILDDEVLGKPENIAHARAMLTRLSGRTHKVHTALALDVEDTVYTAVQISHVRFQILSAAQITAYCASGEPFGKAGAYAIQGQAAAFIAHLTGSYTGVMGLPAHETCALLEKTARAHAAS